MGKQPREAREIKLEYCFDPLSPHKIGQAYQLFVPSKAWRTCSLLYLPRQDVIGVMIGFRIFPFDGYWMHTGANLALGRGSDPFAFKPTGKLTSVAEERELNEGIIFFWRDLIRELDV
jgi:hypothetical protein